MATNRDLDLGERVAECRGLVSAGRYALAHDRCVEALAAFPASLELTYLHALSLARGGNAPDARETLAKLMSADQLTGQVLVDALSLPGRLAKDRYEHDRRRETADEAYQLYAAAYAQTRDLYPAINAASMALLAGDQANCRRLAEVVREQLAGRPALDFWDQATLAEALVLLGEVGAAEAAYRQVVVSAPEKRGDLGSMRRQLLLLHSVCDVGQLLEIVDPGRVVAWCDGGAPGADPGQWAEALARYLRAPGARVGVGYCVPSAGPALDFAQAVVAAGCELHLVLPCAADAFVRECVAVGPRAEEWLALYRLAEASSAQVHAVTDEPWLGDDSPLPLAERVCAGLAVLRAASLSVEARLVATSTSGGLDEPPLTSARPARAADAEPDRRVVRAVLFADLHGFSKLQEGSAPAFFRQFGRLIKGVLDGLARGPVCRNTWGDGLYLVFEEVDDCAECALGLLEGIAQVDWSQLGLDRTAGVRIGLHAGPVYPYEDLVTGQPNYFGSHVTRAARIEPVTAVGCAWATEQFAALLATSGAVGLACDYVGQRLLAKEYGHCGLYRLRRRESAEPQPGQPQAGTI